MSIDTAVLLKINIRNEGDYFYAASPDLPGLHVCGTSAEEVCLSAMKAVKALFKQNRKVEVEVAPIGEDFDSFSCAGAPVQSLVVHRLQA